MKERINGILSEVKTKIAAAASENELQSVKSAYIGRASPPDRLCAEPGQEPGDGAGGVKEDGAEAEGLGGVPGFRLFRAGNSAQTGRPAPHHPDVL